MNIVADYSVSQSRAVYLSASRLLCQPVRVSVLHVKLQLSIIALRMLLLFLCKFALLSFYLSDAACPSSDTNPPSKATSPSYLSLVKSVSWPGTRFVPSTGKLLKILHLNSTHLSGHFISHSGVVLHFTSTSSGNLYVRRSDGSTIIEHDFVSTGRHIHFARVEDHPFVYDTRADGKTYKLPSHRRSKREMEEEYDDRSAQNHTTADEEEMKAAFHQLSIDPHAHLLGKLSQALAEFGIFGYKSPASLPLHMTAMAVARQLPSNETEEAEDQKSFACAEQKLATTAKPIHSKSRQRRGWFFVGIITTIVQRIVEPVIGLVSSCDSIENNHHNDCLGMCGKGCNCQKWVCGNCCWNKGCYQHDLCCTRSTFSCIIPAGFSCYGYLQYPACMY